MNRAIATKGIDSYLMEFQGDRLVLMLLLLPSSASVIITYLAVGDVLLTYQGVIFACALCTVGVISLVFFSYWVRATIIKRVVESHHLTFVSFLDDHLIFEQDGCHYKGYYKDNAVHLDLVATIKNDK